MVGYESTGPYAVPPAPSTEHELSEGAQEVVSQAKGMSRLIKALQIYDWSSSLVIFS
jgi:hypothetical protein